MSNNKNVCHFCNFEFKWDNAKHCPNCGKILINHCEDPFCEISFKDGDSKNEIIELPNNFKFCPSCGAKTTYFNYLSDDKDLPQNGQ